MHTLALLLLAFRIGFATQEECSPGARDLASPTHILRTTIRERLLELAKNNPEVRRLLDEITHELTDKDNLEVFLDRAVRASFRLGLLPKMVTEEKLDAYIRQFSEAIDAELSARGLTADTAGVKYESWNDFSNRIHQDLDLKLTQLPKSELEKGLASELVRKLFEEETDATLTHTEKVKLLVDGPDSFRERKRLIREARDSIHIMSWAFYDDVTGEKMSNLLIQKLKKMRKVGKPFEIKIMVDGLTARNPPYSAQLEKMERAGIEVVRWKSTDSQRPYDGQHRKAMIVDGRASIEGGMNFGDEYSHMGNGPKWRDTDILVEGKGASASTMLFARLWNEQIRLRAVVGAHGEITLDGSRVSEVTSVPIIPESPKGKKVSLMNHTPGKGEKIYRGVLLGLKTAKKSIDIENAYFLLDPVMLRALREAKARGVKIRLLTNSLESVDVPEMAHVMAQSVNQLVSEGFEVYTKKGNTLHSKFFVIDDEYASIGSYNFHPRSHRYEGEIQRNVFDSRFARTVRRAFEKDISEANRIEKPIPLVPNRFAEIFAKYFFDQL